MSGLACRHCEANVPDGTDGLCGFCRGLYPEPTPIARALDAWRQTSEGRTCRDRDILLAPSQGRYLDDRLELAFRAGAEAQERIASHNGTTGTERGFAVIGLHRALGFTAVRNPVLHRGFKFEALWIFGKPRTREEIEIWRAVEPIAATMPRASVHRIPFVPAVPPCEPLSGNSVNSVNSVQTS